MRNIRTATSHLGGWIMAVLLLVLVGPAYAGDGVIEINQAKALAGGVTPGDGEGFPVTLTQAGSYRLTGNLTLPNANTTGIRIEADHITVDLNGFAIIGPTVCTWTDGPPTTTCSPTGSGYGIRGELGGGFAPENITILNGTVRGAGSAGIFFIFGRIERMRLISNGVFGIETPIGAAVDGPAPGNVVVQSWAIRNGLHGISAGERSRIEGNVASFNGSDGIGCVQDCVVKDNVTNDNGGNGINAFGSSVANNTANENGLSGIAANLSSVRGNTVIQNGSFGLVLGSSGYAENVSMNNSSGAVDGGLQTGGNVCDGVLCP